MLDRVTLPIGGLKGHGHGSSHMLQIYGVLNVSNVHIYHMSPKWYIPATLQGRWAHQK